MTSEIIERESVITNISIKKSFGKNRQLRCLQGKTMMKQSNNLEEQVINFLVKE